MIDDAYNMVLKPIIHFLEKHSPFIIGVIINIVIIMFINKVIDALEVKLATKLREKHSDSSLVNLLPILVKVLKAIIIFLLLAGFLQSFGYNVSSLIAGFGITGLAVGFAAKEAIGNVFGSLGLLGDRVYKIGDYIKFDNIEGYVEKINLRSTSIRTLDNFVVNVPNNTIANEAITNVSVCKKRKIDIIKECKTLLKEYRNIGLCSRKEDRLFKCYNLNFSECLDALMLDNNTLVYADPPYFEEHYSRYYHVLNTLCLYDYPSLAVNPQTHEFSAGRYREDRKWHG